MNTSPQEFSFTKFLVQLIIITVILFGVHHFAIQPYLTAYQFHFETWNIYLFHFVTVAALVYFLKHRSKIKPDKIFDTFVILSILKMIAIVIFLLPLFFNKTIDPKASVFSFFIPYFLFLFLEIRYSVKILNFKK